MFASEKAGKKSTPYEDIARSANIRTMNAARAYFWSRVSISLHMCYKLLMGFRMRHLM
jgi:hypothetical protein